MPSLKMPCLDWNEQLRRLGTPRGKVRVVIDTDTKNEIDDPFALVYALCSPEQMSVEAIYAAPFANERSTGPADGMDQSYREILRLLQLAKRSPEGFAFRGAEGFLPAPDQPFRSPAAEDLVRRARQAEDGPLYVMAIGAPTNVASAILMEPSILTRMVVVWLGGHPHYWSHTREFNLEQDVWASRILFDSGVALVQIPCQGVASHLLVTLSELATFIKDQGPIGEYLFETYRDSHPDHFGYSRPIWDIAAAAYLVNPEWVPTQIVHSPILTDQVTWSRDPARHWIRCASVVDRNAIFADFYRKLAALATAPSTSRSVDR